MHRLIQVLMIALNGADQTEQTPFENQIIGCVDKPCTGEYTGKNDDLILLHR